MSAILVPLAVVVGSVGGLLAAIAGVRFLGAWLDWSPEVRRKAVHILTGGYALLFPVLFDQKWPVALLLGAAIALMMWMRLPGQRESGLGSTIHSVERNSWGDVLLAVAIGFLFFRSQGTPILYVLPLAIITLSDSAAALAGSVYGRRVFAVEKGQKSVEGVAVFFVVAWLVSLILLLLFTDLARPNVVLLGLAVAAFGALVEADSWNGYDNLFVPLGIHVFLRENLGSSPGEIGLIACAFIVTIAIFIGFGKRLKLSAHAARGYAIVVFLLEAYSGALATLFPVLLLLSHLYAREKRPCGSAFPDLDLIGAFVALSVAWLFVGESFGPSAIHFFMLTFASAVALTFCLATQDQPGIAALTVPAMLGLFVLVMRATDQASCWHGDLAAVAFVSLSFCAAIASWRPALFDRMRAQRTALAASVVPLLAYVAKVLT